VLARKSWKITFEYGSAKLARDGCREVGRRSLRPDRVTQTIVEINGHTARWRREIHR